MTILTDYRKNLVELVNETLVLLEDPLGERFSSGRIKEALNDVVLDFALKTQTIKEEINIRLLENIYDYDIKLLIEEDGSLRAYGYPIRVGFGGGSYPAMKPTSLLVMDFNGYTRDEKIDPSMWYIDVFSPNRLGVMIPSKDGAALNDANPYLNNMQVTYVAMPEYKISDNDYLDSKISPVYYRYFPFGAAARILDEGDDVNIQKAMQLESEFMKGIFDATVDEWRGETKYSDFRPC